MIENKAVNGETTSVDLIAILTNNGESTATQISPLITDVNYIYTQIPSNVTLAAGESAPVRVHLEPARQDTANQTIILQFASSEGVSQTRNVLVPALTITNSGNLTTKLAAILILLIAIVAVMARTQKQ